MKTEKPNFKLALLILILMFIIGCKKKSEAEVKVQAVGSPLNTLSIIHQKIGKVFFDQAQIGILTTFDHITAPNTAPDVLYDKKYTVSIANLNSLYDKMDTEGGVKFTFVEIPDTGNYSFLNENKKKLLYIVATVTDSLHHNVKDENYMLFNLKNNIKLSDVKISDNDLSNLKKKIKKDIKLTMDSYYKKNTEYIYYFTKDIEDIICNIGYQNVDFEIGEVINVEAYALRNHFEKEINQKIYDRYFKNRVGQTTLVGQLSVSLLPSIKATDADYFDMGDLKP